MDLSNSKIQSGDMQGKGNVGKPQKPGYSFTEQQRVMDELVRDVVAPKHNELVEDHNSLVEEVNNRIIGGGMVPAGGEAGQALVKRSETAQDVIWADTVKRLIEGSGELAADGWTGADNFSSRTSIYTPVAETGITDGEVEVNKERFKEKVGGSRDAVTLTYDGTNWKRGENNVTLEDYGIEITSGTPTDGNTITVSVVGEETLDMAVFKQKVGNSEGAYAFRYDAVTETWFKGVNQVGNNANALATEYGITYTGTPENNDTITVVYTQLAPFVQTVGAAGITASDTPHITPVYSDTLETAVAEKEAWALVCDAKAGEGAITFTCFESKPEIDIPLQIEVIR